MKHIFLLAIIASTLILGCNKDKQSETDRNIILQYIEDNNLDAVEGEYGLFYVIDVPGGEEKPTVTSNVNVIYHGELVDGTVFDATPDGEVSMFSLGGVIQGWQLGIPLFGRGGSGKLLIPSAIGYGTRTTGIIPANSVLIFDIELLGF